ncbi:MAG: hypothetical protein Q9166_001768 [cf. Caloplaca sp. 2 TL-2023]
MPEPQPDHVSTRPGVMAGLDHEEVADRRHTMAMSYMVTVVHFFSSDKPRIDVIDSRSDQNELLCIGKELGCDGKEVTCRLVVTEDLPRATYELLEHTVGIDPRILDDHRSNGHGPGLVGQADLGIDKAPQSSSAIAVLLYPPLWDLKSRQGNKYKFFVPADLQYTETSRENSIASAQYLEGINTADVSDSGCAFRTQKLLNHVLRNIGPKDDVQQNLTSCLSTWLVVNAYTAFEASAESSIRSWHSIKSLIDRSQNRPVDNKGLCERSRQLIEIKLHLMNKAAFDLGIDSTRQTFRHAFSAGRLPQNYQMDYALQQWQRSRQSLQWVLDDIAHSFKSNESGLQIDLMMTQVEESRKAMQQAEVVKRLTALAFVFIPISTVCSAFGMNIEQFNRNLPSVWVFVTVALAVAISTVICSLELSGNIFWAMLSLLNSLGTAWRTWFRYRQHWWKPGRSQALEIPNKNESDAVQEHRENSPSSARIYGSFAISGRLSHSFKNPGF